MKLLSFVVVPTIALAVSCSHLSTPSDLKEHDVAWSLTKKASKNQNVGHVNSTRFWKCVGTRGRVETGGVSYVARIKADENKSSSIKIGEKNSRSLRYFGFSLAQPSHQAWGELGEDGLPIRLLVYSRKTKARSLRAQLEIYTESGVRTQTVRNIKCSPE